RPGGGPANRGRGDLRVSAQAEPKPTSAVSAAFGANEWLVDELYEQYLKDKNAVDPAWWDFFADYKPGETDPATAPAPRGEHRRETPEATASRPEPAEPARDRAATTSSSTSTQATAEQTAAERKAAKPALATKEPASTQDAPAPPPVATAQPATAPYAQRPATRTAAATEQAADNVEKLRGPAARVVTNMEA